jgi:uridine kinase
MAMRKGDLGTGAAAALARNPLLARLDDAERAVLLERGELVKLPPRTRVHGDADAGHHLYLVVEGSAVWRREQLAIRHLGPGDHFGELALLGERHLGETVTSETALTVVRLSSGALSTLERDAPHVALKLTQSVADALGREVARLSGDMGLLLRGRTLPRASSVQVTVDGDRREVATGTRLRDILPAEQDGALVVAGLLGSRPVSLQTPVFTDSAVRPLTIAHWEGRQIYAQAVGLLLLEAAQSEVPHARVRLGPSRGAVQVVQVEGPVDEPASGLAERLRAAMVAHAATDAPYRLEYWATDEAILWFEHHGWADAVKLLRLRRQATVRLASCGECYALSMGPLLPSTGAVQGFTLEPHPEGLALGLGPRDPRARGRAPEAPAAAARPHDGDMVGEHQRWLTAMGVTSVGALSELCIDGRVTQLIRVAEGFHEKRISRIADQIAAARDRIRIISIAGPSSSGKTTFIKRLTVQLQINGVNPVALSLDDYYVDRERTPRDEKGDWDFESLGALDLETLQRQVRRLLAGEAVRTPRYDFLSGVSRPDGGHELQLRPGDTLML